MIKKDTILTVLAIAVIVVIIGIVLNVNFVSAERRNCPHTIEGNKSAEFTIQYIDSPTCFWCFLQTPSLNRMIETKGHAINLESYDIDFCTEITTKHGFRATPSWVFKKGDQEFTRVGYIREGELNGIVCQMTGLCE